MGEFLKILQSVMPLPILIGVAIFVISAWILKQIRGYTGNTPLFKDRVFYYLLACSFLGVISYYLFSLYILSKPEIKFSSNELGIYICPFSNDPNNFVPNAIEAALTFTLNKEKYKDVKVVISNLDEVPHEEHIYDIGLVRNATLVISGKFVHGEKFWVQIANPIDRTAKRIPTPFELDKPDQIVKILDDELSGIRRRSDEDDFQISQNRLREAIDLIAALQYKLDNAVDRIEKLEKFLNSSEIAPNTPFTTSLMSKPDGKAWAVLIGIGDYKNKDLIDLEYPSADLKAMENLLVRSGVKSDNIILIKDSEATKTNIQRKVIDFLRQKTSQNDRVLLYYSGHAVTQTTQSEREIGYLCPTDFSFSELVSTGISMSQMKEWFDLIPAKQIALIVDACYAGFLGDINITRGVRILKLSAKDLIPPKPRLLPSENNRNLIILTAGGADQYALEGPKWGHGLFTFHVLNGLMGKADLNNDKFIQSDELYNYVYPKVVNESDNGQAPMLFGWGMSSITLLETKDGIFKEDEFLQPMITDNKR